MAEDETGARFLAPELRRFEAAGPWLFQLLTWERELQGTRHHPARTPRRGKSEAGSGSTALPAGTLAA